VSGPKYRAVSAALLDSPEFQDLPSYTRWVYVVLTATLGPSGIEERYPAALTQELVARVGGSARKVTRALDELEAGGWIRREGRLFWCVRQLADDPFHKPGGDAMKSIAAHVKGLPDCGLTREYRAFYRRWLEGLLEGLEEGGEEGLDTLPETGSREEGVGNRENGKGKEKEKREAPVRGASHDARPLRASHDQLPTTLARSQVSDIPAPAEPLSSQEIVRRKQAWKTGLREARQQRGGEELDPYELAARNLEAEGH